MCERVCVCCHTNSHSQSHMNTHQIQTHVQALFNDTNKENALFKTDMLQVLHKIEWHQPFRKMPPPPSPSAASPPDAPLSTPPAAPMSGAGSLVANNVSLFPPPPPPPTPPFHHRLSCARALPLPTFPSHPPSLPHPPPSLFRHPLQKITRK